MFIAGAFYTLKASESKLPRLKKSLKSRVLLDTGAFHESKMSENAERPASSRPQISIFHRVPFFGNFGVFGSEVIVFS